MGGGGEGGDRGEGVTIGPWEHFCGSSPRATSSHLGDRSVREPLTGVTEVESSAP